MFLGLTDQHKSILERASSGLEPYRDQIFDQWRIAFQTIVPTIELPLLHKMEQIYRSYFKLLEQEIDSKEFYDIILKTVRKLRRAGITFEQLMLSFHLIEDSCLPFMKKLFPDKDRLIDVLTVMDYSCHSCISALAVIYFEQQDSDLETTLQLQSKESSTRLVEKYELTDREFEILKRVVDGDTNREIAESLGISSKTVENHRANLMRKLGLTHVVELVKFAVRHRII